MPTYEYRCESCGRTVEVVQGFSDPPLTTCESCGGELRKVYAPVGIVFKGSGFYKTDSRSSSSKVASRSPAESGGDAKAPATGTDGAATPSSAAPAATTPTPPSSTTTERSTT